MILALLLAAVTASPSPATAVEAERAFAADAKRIGQWTAFGRWAAPNALMFLPKPIDAREFFGKRADPKAPVEWWPNHSYVRCDGRTAINHGGAAWSQGFATNFTTVWFKGSTGWRWVYDGGQTVKQALPRDAAVEVKQASCRSIPRRVAGSWAQTAALRAPDSAPLDAMAALSADRSLAWRYQYDPASKYLMFRGWLWDGQRYALVIDQAIAPDPE